jgi:hypothetical protein
MTALQPEVVPIFATPFGFSAVPGAESFNPEVARILTERATPERADPVNRQAFTYRSRDDLIDWTDDPVRKATNGMLSAVLGVARTINDFTDERFASFRLQARAWYTIVRSDGCVPSGSYANAAWCAVYCVAAPPASQTRFDSGVLRLHESMRATMFADATTASTLMPYRPGHNTWRPVAGEVVVFPASLVHEVALLRSPGELILMFALARFVAPGQTGVPW